jgi:hypothetical protein
MDYEHQDLLQWDQAASFTTSFKAPSPWRFSESGITIKRCHYPLDTCSVIELALLDIQAAYWQGRGTEFWFLKHYHDFMRSRVEDALQSQSGVFRTPPFLIPWLQRTFSLCKHDREGRKDMEIMAQSFPRRPFQYSGMINRFSANMAQIYR